METSSTWGRRYSPIGLLAFLLTAVAPAAHAGIQVSPPVVDFGDVPVWSLSERTVRVLPTGQGPQQLTGFQLTGGSSGAYRVIPPAGYQPGMTLPRGGISFRVQFNPPVPLTEGFHPHTARIEFAQPGNTGDATDLLGSTTGAFVGGFFVPLDFGQQPVGSVSTQGMIARNHGTARVQFEIVGVTTAPNQPFSPHPEFSVRPGSLVLAPGATQIPVTWAPETTGQKAGWVEFGIYEEFQRLRLFVMVSGEAF